MQIPLSIQPIDEMRFNLDRENNRGETPRDIFFFKYASMREIDNHLWEDLRDLIMSSSVTISGVTPTPRFYEIVGTLLWYSLRRTQIYERNYTSMKITKVFQLCTKISQCSLSIYTRTSDWTPTREPRYWQLPPK